MNVAALQASVGMEVPKSKSNDHETSIQKEMMMACITCNKRCRKEHCIHCYVNGQRMMGGGYSSPCGVSAGVHRFFFTFIIQLENVFTLVSPVFHSLQTIPMLRPTPSLAHLT